MPPPSDDTWSAVAGSLGTILVVGVFGNILSLYVFHRGPKSKTSPCAFYWKSLSAADLYVLLLPCFELFLLSMRIIRYRAFSTFLCKFALFNTTFPVEVSTWITVSVTVDRALCVCFPMKFRANASSKGTRIKVAVIVVVLILSNMYPVITADIDASSTNVRNIENNRSQNISFTPGNRRPTSERDSPANTTEMTGAFHNNKKPSGLYCGASYGRQLTLHKLVHEGIFIFSIPFLINGVCNVLILHRLYMNASKMKRMSKSGVSTRYSQANHVTYRVLAISVMHFITMAPYGCFFLYMQVMKTPTNQVIKDARLSVECVYFANSAVNVFVYCATGNDFRKDLKGIASTVFARRKPPPSGTLSTRKPMNASLYI